MTTTNCPLCGNDTLETKEGEYRFDPPSNVPGGTMVIADACWQACNSCGEEILPDELTQVIEIERNRRLGLLTPDDIRTIRKKTGLSATEMAHVLGVGEKVGTRCTKAHAMYFKDAKGNNRPRTLVMGYKKGDLLLCPNGPSPSIKVSPLFTKQTPFEFFIEESWPVAVMTEE